MGNYCRKNCSCCSTICPCFFNEKADSYKPEQPATVFANNHVGDQTDQRVSLGFPDGPPNVIINTQRNNDLYVALYDYKAATTNELSFNAGDQLQILDFTTESWWRARVFITRGKSEGYIPANYVAPVASIESKP